MITVAKKTFEVINASKLDKNLKGNEYRVYEFLTSKAGNDTAECYYLNSTIGGELGLHADTVRRVINRLVQKGYLLKQLVKQKHTNNNSANSYTICAMLDEKSLELKKKMIELFPVMKKGVHTKELMLSKAFETLCELSIEVKEVVETVVEEVKEVVETVVNIFKPNFEVEEEVVVEEVATEEVLSPMEIFKRNIAERNAVANRESAEQLVIYAEQLELQAVTVENLIPLVNKYGEYAVRNAMERAYAIEYPHFNTVNKFLRDKFEGGRR